MLSKRVLRYIVYGVLFCVVRWLVGGPKKKNVGNVNEETFSCSLRNCSYEQACCRCKWEEWYSKKEKKKGANELNKYTEKEMC